MYHVYCVRDNKIRNKTTVIFGKEKKEVSRGVQGNKEKLVNWKAFRLCWQELPFLEKKEERSFVEGNNVKRVWNWKTCSHQRHCCPVISGAVLSHST